jgi:hypothetical protein
MWPLLLRGLLVGAAGYALLKLAEYVADQQDETVTKPIVEEEKRKRGMDGYVIWADKPTCYGTIFTEAELKAMAAGYNNFTYDSEEKALKVGRT